MTLASTNSRVSYTGNGVTTSFSFPYYFVNKSDLVVYVAGVLQVLNTDYTIAGSGPYPTGQNIVFAVAPANLASIVIARVVPYTQTLDLVENDPLPAEDLEKRLDLTTMMIQQVVEALGRAIVIPITDVTGTNVTMPSAATRANQALLFDASGNVSVGLPSAAPVSAAMQPVVAATTLALARTALGATTVGNAVFTAADAATARAALGAAASGANSDITSLSGITSINGGQIGGFRNLVVNGDFDFWQQATTYALTSTIAYGSADQWAAFMVSSAAGVFNRSTSVPADLGLRYSAQMGRTAASALTNTIAAYNPWETAEALKLAGKTVTFSFYAKAGANYSSASNIFSALLFTGKGTDQAVTSVGSWTNEAQQIAHNAVLTTSWQRFSATVTLPSDITQIYLQMKYTPVGVAGADDNVYFTGVRVEPSSVATPLEREPEAIGKARCQRFYWKSFNYATVVAQNAGVTTGELGFTAIGAGAVANRTQSVMLPVVMRAAPTVIFFNPSVANAQARDASAAADCSSTTTNRVGDNSFTMSYVGAAGTGIGNVIVVHATASARL